MRDRMPDAAGMLPTAGLPVRSRFRSLVDQQAGAVEEESSSCARCQELTRIRRDLHDEIGSALVCIRMQLELAQLQLAERSEQMCELLSRTMTDVSAVVEQIRCLCSAPQRAGDSRRDLGTSLERLVDRMNATLSGRLRVELHTAERLGDLPPEVVLAATMIVREALTNVMKHSQGDWCRISVEAHPGRLLLQVVDNGRGWPNEGGGTGCGLRNMRSRARELDGDCLTGPGVPTGFVVAAWLPIRSDDGAPC
jgi:signal transduction histidine kinase